MPLNLKQGALLGETYRGSLMQVTGQAACANHSPNCSQLE